MFDKEIYKFFVAILLIPCAFLLISLFLWILKERKKFVKKNEWVWRFVSNFSLLALGSGTLIFVVLIVLLLSGASINITLQMAVGIVSCLITGAAILLTFFSVWFFGKLVKNWQKYKHFDKIIFWVVASFIFSSLFLLWFLAAQKLPEKIEWLFK